MAATTSNEGNDWSTNLVIDSDRLLHYLGESSLTFSMINSAGECLRKTHELLLTLELLQTLEEEARIDGNFDEDDDDSSDDTSRPSLDHDLCVKMVTAASNFFRNPAMRFFALHDLVLNESKSAVFRRAITQILPNKFHEYATEAHAHASVSHAGYLKAYLSFSLDSGTYDRDEDASFCNEVCKSLVAVLDMSLPTLSSSFKASVYVMLGNFSLASGYLSDAVEHLEEAIRLDPEGCFGSYYTIANVMQVTLPNASSVPPREAKKIRGKYVKMVKYFSEYVDRAPRGHWHIHRAYSVIPLFTGVTLARGSEKHTSVASRHPDFVPKCSECFRKCVDALELYENIYGKESSDFKNMFKQLSAMLTAMAHDGLLDPSEIAPNNYICSNPRCSKGDHEAKLMKCAKCHCRRYCSRECQVAHWKNGHKKECKQLSQARAERISANPHPLRRLDPSKVPA